MASQVTNGKGFEWAVAAALADQLHVNVLRSSESANAKAAYERLSTEKQGHFQRCAEQAASYITAQEQLLAKHPRDIALLPDAAGIRGDVRDVLVRYRDEIDSATGISCKTNHEAYKHPRISGQRDFIKEWGLGAGCSSEYWDAVRPVFAELKKIQLDSGKTATWASLGNYQARYYVPVLKAWRAELLKWAGGTDQQSHNAATALCRYVLGNKDFWKVISYEDGVKLFAFNTGNTLGTPVTPLADRVDRAEFKEEGGNSIDVSMSKGYQFNFRIHNASSRVEPSLKFDVKSIGIPSAVYQHWINF